MNSNLGFQKYISRVNISGHRLVSERTLARSKQRVAMKRKRIAIIGNTQDCGCLYLSGTKLMCFNTAQESPRSWGEGWWSRVGIEMGTVDKILEMNIWRLSYKILLTFMLKNFHNKKFLFCLDEPHTLKPASALPIGNRSIPSRNEKTQFGKLLNSYSNLT